MDAFVDQHFFEIGQLMKKMLSLFSGAEAKDLLYDSAIVPTAIKQGDLASSGKLIDVTLEIPLFGFFVGRF